MSGPPCFRGYRVELPVKMLGGLVYGGSGAEDEVRCGWMGFLAIAVSLPRLGMPQCI